MSDSKRWFTTSFLPWRKVPESDAQSVDLCTSLRRLGTNQLWPEALVLIGLLRSPWTNLKETGHGGRLEIDLNMDTRAMYFPWTILNPVDAVLPRSELRTSSVKVEVGGRPGLPVPNSPNGLCGHCLLYTSPSPRDQLSSRMPSSA